MESQEDRNHRRGCLSFWKPFPPPAGGEIPRPETAYCLRNSCAPENVCRGKGCRPAAASTLPRLVCTGERLPRNGLPSGKGVLLSGLVCTGKRLLRIGKSKFGCVPLCATGAASVVQNRSKSPSHVDKLWTDLGISPHRTGRNRKTCNAQKNEQLFAKIAKTIKIARILAEYFVQ